MTDTKTLVEGIRKVVMDAVVALPDLETEDRVAVLAAFDPVVTLGEEYCVTCGYRMPEDEEGKTWDYASHDAVHRASRGGIRTTLKEAAFREGEPERYWGLEGEAKLDRLVEKYYKARSML